MTIAILALALILAAGVGSKLVEKVAHDKFVERAACMKAAAGAQADAPVTEEDLRELPEPMARYMRFSGALGQKPISAVHLLHSGRFKPSADTPWMPIRGEYFITTKKPSFTWHGRVGIAGVNVVAFDSYANGRGRMLVKALSLFPIVDDQSTQVSQSGFGRCVAELTMAQLLSLQRNGQVDRRADTFRT